MSEWISVSERLPMEPGSVPIYESIRVIATDGEHVCQCYFDAGHGAGTPWASWSSYNDMPAKAITHWMPLPPPPTE